MNHTILIPRPYSCGRSLRAYLKMRTAPEIDCEGLLSKEEQFVCLPTLPSVMSALGGKRTLPLTLVPPVDEPAGEQSHWGRHSEGQQDYKHPSQPFASMTLLAVEAVSVEGQEHQNAKCRQSYQSAREAA